MSHILHYVTDRGQANELEWVLVTRRPTVVSWTHPQCGYVKLNLDGSCTVSQSIAVGGLIWDAVGNWLYRFIKSIASGTIRLAEIWSIYEGLQFVWLQGCTCIEVESESLQSGKLYSSHPDYSLLAAFQELLHRNWNSKVSHIYRDANRAVDRLAHLGQHLQWGLYPLHEAPPSVNSFLLDDYTNTAAAVIL